MDHCGGQFSDGVLRIEPVWVSEMIGNEDESRRGWDGCVLDKLPYEAFEKSGG